MSDPPSSKMMENKYTIIHIACEIVVVLGLVFYFNSKNKKVLGYIEELISKIDELEELNLGLEKAVKAHDKVIMNLSTQVSELKEFIKSQGEVITPVVSTPTVETSEITPPFKKNNLRKKLGVNSIPRKPKEVTVQIPATQEIVSEQHEEEDEEEDEEELDKELSDELEELQVNHEDVEELDISNEEDLKKTP